MFILEFLEIKQIQAKQIFIQGIFLLNKISTLNRFATSYII